MRIIWIAIIIAGLTSCRSKVSDNQKNTDHFITDSLKYAGGFDIQHAGDDKLLTVSNPWQKAKGISYHYLLTHDSLASAGKDTLVIHIPVTKVVCLSTTHVAMLNFIGEIQSIKGIASGGYVNNRIIHDKLENDEMAEVGYNEDLNFESILKLQPDVVFIYGVSGDVLKSVNKLAELGIKVVYVADYLEDDPLGKMEWVKFMAAFFDRDSLAAAKFDSVAQHYNQLKILTSDVNQRPNVLLGLPWKGTWYVTGQHTFAARLIEDAGGNYLWKDLDSRVSEPYGLETVYARAVKADVWLNPGAVNSLKELAAVDERFSQLPVFISDEIYNNNRRINAAGGNDYWESGIVTPDVILADLIHILHPDILPGHALYYYKKIE